jgi:hypothetical protein
MLRQYLIRRIKSASLISSLAFIFLKILHGAHAPLFSDKSRYGSLKQKHFASTPLDLATTYIDFESPRIADDWR